MGEETASSRWGTIDETGDAESFRSYLDVVTGRERMRVLKRRSYRLLSPAVGDRLLDVGCGTGGDVAALAEEVGPDGTVVGVDNSTAMIEEARNRASESESRSGAEPASEPGSGSASVSFRTADAEALPFKDGAFDGSRADRVLQHLERPREALAELRRVTHPGGRVAVTDPDWGTLVVDAPEDGLDELTARILDPEWACARTGRIGRRLRGWAVEAGFEVLDLDAETLVLTDFEAADEVLGLSGRVERMREAGALDEDAAAQWLDGLRAADEEGTFFGSLTLYTVAGAVPDSAEFE